MGQLTEACEPSHRLYSAVEQAVEHAVPVDGDSLMLIPLFLLRLSADAVPVTGAERETQAAPGHHFKPMNKTVILRFER